MIISDEMVERAGRAILSAALEIPEDERLPELTISQLRHVARAALTAALQGSVVVPAEVREIVDLYFAPWGAAKGARWEALSGDQPFNAEIAMSLIEAALPRQDGDTATGGAS